ncbi:MAG: Flagella accessory protein C (FlaC) [Candidatus Argoarchaeum ethanivorans]|uniref:Flagella accessory protein C (FlaC) n=1 Tax=Candidatus Argoarchaeum ethanivorans TaxID=2608793 RepID=A0A811TBU9_9EURY|nr:MAG: Flagella accessory protein C (FlaC) [Candidatus Argoarchaeum ethanivorans]
MNIMKKLRRKKSDVAKAREEEEIISEEESTVETQQPLQESAVDPIVLERITNIENKTPRIETSISVLKRENDEIKNRITQVDTKLIDMLSLYEVVANQVNPFVGLSKVTTANIEKLERLQQQAETMENQMISIENDLRISLGELDIVGIIRTQLEEEAYA